MPDRVSVGARDGPDLGGRALTVRDFGMTRGDMNWFAVLAHHAVRSPDRVMTVFEGARDHLRRDGPTQPRPGRGPERPGRGPR